VWDPGDRQRKDLEIMKDLLGKIKKYFDQGGFRRPDFWVLITLIIALAAGFGPTMLMGIALLPAFLAGFYLAVDTEPFGDDGDDGPDEFAIDPDWDPEYGKVA
jgi:hypothetical protein